MLWKFKRYLHIVNLQACFHKELEGTLTERDLEEYERLLATWFDRYEEFDA